jgi:hypothetical protein
MKENHMYPKWIHVKASRTSSSLRLALQASEFLVIHVNQHHQQSSFSLSYRTA